MSERLKVAVLDDEPRAISVISASVESVFRSYDTEILLETFTAPEELLDRLNTFSFDLIFLDISMPGMDGLMLIQSLLTVPICMEFHSFTNCVAVLVAATEKHTHICFIPKTEL